MKLVHGVGFNDKKYKTKVGGKNTIQYSLWINMIARCYSPNMLKGRPTYKDCIVSDEFKNFSFFHDWFNDQYGNKIDNPNLDKDLLIRGNKIYSPDTCLILPPIINAVTLDRKSDRGEYPLGVSWHKRTKRLTVQCNIKGKRKTLGYFDCEVEAFNCYKTAKELEVKRIANEWVDQIDPRAYQALMNYTVSIDD